ncbi:MAG TPA: 30S ribosome-binding factor RbfA [Candidatus Caccovivens faecavium]|mgnify:CR=1 FL=1|nr:30S ribosome-binding factor RbfA [Candidatus Caccovivens faecavium]
MSNRQERANSEIQKCLIEIIQEKMNDPRLNKIISVTEVKVSPDFKYCKVKISVLDVKDIEAVTSVLQKSEGYIKKELGKMLDMPYMPKLKFEVDKGAISTLRVEEILKNLNIPPKEEESDGE